MLLLYSVSHCSFTVSLTSKAKPMPIKLPKQLTTDYCCVLILCSPRIHLLSTGAFILLLSICLWVLTVHPCLLGAPHLLFFPCPYFDLTFSQCFLYSLSPSHYISSHLSIFSLLFTTTLLDIHIFLQAENTCHGMIK